MLDKLNRLAADSLAQAMETVAFIVPEPAERVAPGPAQAVMVTMPFSGPVSGVVEMVAPQALGTALTAGAGEDAPTAQSAQDALKELLNVACGDLLTRAVEPGGPGFDISLPRLAEFDSAVDWQPFISTPGARVLDADGILIAIRVRAAA